MTLCLNWIILLWATCGFTYSPWNTEFNAWDIYRWFVLSFCWSVIWHQQIYFFKIFFRFTGQCNEFSHACFQRRESTLLQRNSTTFIPHDVYGRPWRSLSVVLFQKKTLSAALFATIKNFYLKTVISAFYLIANFRQFWNTLYFA